MAPRVFLITGTSTGFGQELVKVVLGKGDHVIATARNSSKLSFPDANDSNSLLVDLDVTKKESIDKAFDAAIKKFKRVDVVVNNAGYGEETTTSNYWNDADLVEHRSVWSLRDVVREADPAANGDQLFRLDGCHKESHGDNARLEDGRCHSERH
jgi:NAD(P)-dependent dehydrogenase (short-subunit alcohol dehydrogenase family)